MSDEKNDEAGEVNEVVKAMGKDMKPDVPAGLAVIPKDANVHALARRIGGEIVKNEMEFHCLACGWNKTLQFDKDEMAAMDNKISDYTGPCPGCGCMTLAPKAALWGADFPSMNASAMQQKREEARVQAEELVAAVANKVGDMVPGGGAAPKSEPEVEAPVEPDEDLPAEADLSKLKPR